MASMTFRLISVIANSTDTRYKEREPPSHLDAWSLRHLHHTDTRKILKLTHDFTTRRISSHNIVCF